MNFSFKLEKFNQHQELCKLLSAKVSEINSSLSILKLGIEITSIFEEYNKDIRQEIKNLLIDEEIHLIKKNMNIWTYILN